MTGAAARDYTDLIRYRRIYSHHRSCNVQLADIFFVDVKKTFQHFIHHIIRIIDEFFHGILRLIKLSLPVSQLAGLPVKKRITFDVKS